MRTELDRLAELDYARKETTEKNMTDITKKLLANKVSIEIILDATGLTEAEVLALRDES